VPNDEPAIATEDGGVIVKSGIIYDQNGAATGQVGSLPIQSWRGNTYQKGSVKQLAATPPILAQTLWAQQGGSPSRNNAAGRPWYFKLVWQNNCSPPATWPCGFVLYPENPLDNTALAIDATSQATPIKAAALAALKKAFDKFPVTVNVTEGATGTGDHRANVVDGDKFDVKEYCGVTAPLPGITVSTVYYRKHMEMAQFALPITLITAQDVQNALARPDLMKAIGTGIGNTAAHEIGHQFFLDRNGMEDASTGTYNGAAGCDPRTAGGYDYGFGTITWEAVTFNAWKSALGAGWHK
jgi:hypothetical protein